MRKDIKVSFKNNPEEDKLYDDIITNCKFIGQSAWMKLAASEKLERDNGSNGNVHKTNVNNQNGFGLLNSCEDLFSQ
jgi:hypothetical protein